MVGWWKVECRAQHEKSPTTVVIVVVVVAEKKKKKWASENCTNMGDKKHEGKSFGSDPDKVLPFFALLIPAGTELSSRRIPRRECSKAGLKSEFGIYCDPMYLNQGTY